jgi:hypothetical protein
VGEYSGVVLEVKADGSRYAAAAMILIALMPLWQAILLRDAVRLVVGVVLLGIGFWFTSGRERLTIASDGVVHTKFFGPLRYSRRYRRDEVQRPPVEVFSFDPWDPHIALDLPGEKTMRIGWGYPEEELRKMVDRLKVALDE